MFFVIIKLIIEIVVLFNKLKLKHINNNNKNDKNELAQTFISNRTDNQLRAKFVIQNIRRTLTQTVSESNNSQIQKNEYHFANWLGVDERKKIQLDFPIRFLS